MVGRNCENPRKKKRTCWTFENKNFGVKNDGCSPWIRFIFYRLTLMTAMHSKNALKKKRKMKKSSRRRNFEERILTRDLA